MGKGKKLEKAISVEEMCETNERIWNCFNEGKRQGFGNKEEENRIGKAERAIKMVGRLPVGTKMKELYVRTLGMPKATYGWMSKTIPKGGRIAKVAQATKKAVGGQ